MGPREELRDDLDLAENWYLDDIKSQKNPVQSKQLRYSLCNKLAADWQKFVKNSALECGVATNNLGNCWPSQIQRAYSLAGKSDPFAPVDGKVLTIFDKLNPVRNAIDHGDEPQVPNDSDIEGWLGGLRSIVSTYGT